MKATDLATPPAYLEWFLRWPVAIYVTATAIGVVMRLILTGWVVPLPFDHLLHAHSHALYFGWAGLVLLAVGATEASAYRRLQLAAALVPVMAAAFLASGYAPVSIAVSTVVMVVWFSILWSWWSKAPSAALRLAFAYVIGSGLGIVALAINRATGLGGRLAGELAVHAFLNTFGWFFVLGTVALAIQVASPDPSTTRKVLVGWAIWGWATFPLGVAGGPDVPWLGPLARTAAVCLAIPGLMWVHQLWRLDGSRFDKMMFRSAAVWLGMRVMADLAAAIGGSALLRAVGRDGVVLYLHVLLLGYVTTLCAWWLCRRSGLAPTAALMTHQAGTALMVAGLAGSALGRWRTGNVAAAVGAGVVWLAGARWGYSLWHRHRNRGSTPIDIPSRP